MTVDMSYCSWLDKSGWGARWWGWLQEDNWPPVLFICRTRTAILTTGVLWSKQRRMMIGHLHDSWCGENLWVPEQNAAQKRIHGQSEEILLDKRVFLSNKISSLCPGIGTWTKRFKRLTSSPCEAIFSEYGRVIESYYFYSGIKDSSLSSSSIYSALSGSQIRSENPGSAMKR